MAIDAPEIPGNEALGQAHILRLHASEITRTLPQLDDRAEAAALEAAAILKEAASELEAPLGDEDEL